MAEDQASIYALAYGEGIRVVEGQAVTLEQLRLRVAAILGVATVSSSFLVGIVARAARPDKDGLYWLGVAVGCAIYAALLVLTVQVLRPTYEWHFNFSPNVIIDGYADHEQPATLAETHRDLARRLTENIDHNEANLKFMRRRLQWMLTLLILEVSTWGILVAKTAKTA